MIAKTPSMFSKATYILGINCQYGNLDAAVLRVDGTDVRVLAKEEKVHFR